MDELVQDAAPADEVPEVVQVVDAQEVLGGYVQSTDDRLGQVADKIDDLALRVQSGQEATGTVTVDESQWEQLTGDVASLCDSASLTLFLSLLLMCLVSAILGTRLFSVFVEGWRH